jgi:hypothetical protein
MFVQQRTATKLKSQPNFKVPFKEVNSTTVLKSKKNPLKYLFGVTSNWFGVKYAI